MRARASVVGCRLGGKGADGTRLYPRLRERTCTSGTPPEAESGKAKVFINVSCFERGQSFNLCFGPVQVFILSSYTLRQIKPKILVSFPFSRLNSPQALPRGSQLAFDDGARENDREARGQQPGHAYLPPRRHITNSTDCTKAFPDRDRSLG